MVVHLSNTASEASPHPAVEVLLLLNPKLCAVCVRAGGGPMTISEFEFAVGIDNQNLAKLGIYIQQSNIVHKVSHGWNAEARIAST